MVIAEIKRLFSHKIIIWVMCLVLITNFSYVLYQAAQFTDVNQETVNLYQNYESEIDEKLLNEERKLNIDLFKNKSQIEHNIRYYRYLKTIDTTTLPPEGLSNTILNHYYGVTLVLFTVVLVHFLYFEDHLYQHQHFFIYTKRNLFLIKLLALVSILFAWTILYFIWVMLFYHSWSLSKIQLLTPLRFIFLKLSIFQYWVLLFTKTFLVAISIGYLSYGLFKIVSKSEIVYLGLGLFLIIEFLLWTLIPSNSVVYWLSKINILNWLLSEQIFHLKTLLAIALITILTSYHQLRIAAQFKNRLTLSCTSKVLWIQEMFRILISNKGWMILLILISYSSYRYVDYGRNISESTRMTESIRSQYYGEITSDKLLQLQQQIETLQQTKQQLESCNNLGQCDFTIEQLEQKAESISNLGIYQEILAEIQQQKSSVFINRNGYELLLGERSFFSHALHFLIITLSLSALVCLNVVGEYQHKIIKLYQTTSQFKTRRRITNIILYLLIFSFIGIVYGFFMLKISKVHPISKFNLPLFTLIESTSSISFAVVLCLLMISHLMIYVFLFKLAYVLAKKFETAIVILSMLTISLIILIVYQINPYWSPFVLLTVKGIESLWASGIWGCLLLVVYYFGIKSFDDI